MPAEAIHETGRRGLLEAKELIWRLLGDAATLPFNAYDHPEKLNFNADGGFGVGPFNFDLRGSLERPDSRHFGGQQAAEVLVEVKNYSDGTAFLNEYRVFLRRAAVLSTDPAHTTTWFLFIASVPFGTTRGASLCDGRFLRDSLEGLPDPVKTAGTRLESRVALIIATRSFREVLSIWGRNA